MRLGERVVNGIVHGLTGLLCAGDASELVRVPQHGPLILIVNHVNFLEIPILHKHLVPRRVAAFAKIESWRNPLVKGLFDLWGAIPVRRGEADPVAFRRGLAALASGMILAITPEGTRSHDGRLQYGHSGIVPLALRSGAPLLPVAVYGTESFWSRLRRLRRTKYGVAVGDPFTIDTGGEKVRRRERQQIADEVMFQLAAILPPRYRGVYADFTEATDRFLRFSPPAISGIRRTREGTDA